MDPSGMEVAAFFYLTSVKLQNLQVVDDVASYRSVVVGEPDEVQGQTRENRRGVCDLVSRITGVLVPGRN